MERKGASARRTGRSRPSRSAGGRRKGRNSTTESATRTGTAMGRTSGRRAGSRGAAARPKGPSSSTQSASGRGRGRKKPGWAAARPEATRRDEERAHGGLEEQVVPLEGEEVLPHGDEGEVEHPQERQAVAGRQVEDEAEAQDRARDPGGAERAVARVEPEDGRRVEESARGAQVVVRGKQALAAEEQRRLREKREEGDQEDGAQQAEEEVADEGATGSRGGGRRQGTPLP